MAAAAKMATPAPARPPLPTPKPLPPPRRPKAPSKAERAVAGAARYYLVVSDVHVPHNDPRACGAVFEYAKDLRPHGLIFNGDILDFDEISKYSEGSLAKLEGRRFHHTWDAGARFIDELRGAAGNRVDEQHFLDGNHEYRLERWIAKDSNGVFAGDPAFSLAARLGLKERGVVHHTPYGDASVRLGHLVVTHGRYSNKYAAAKHLDVYRHSVLVGHTHSPQLHVSPGLLHAQVCYVGGHLADPLSEVMNYAPRPNAWIQGFTTVAVQKSGNFSVQLHTIWDGHFDVGGKGYGG